MLSATPLLTNESKRFSLRKQTKSIVCMRDRFYRGSSTSTKDYNLTYRQMTCVKSKTRTLSTLSFSSLKHINRGCKLEKKLGERMHCSKADPTYFTLWLRLYPNSLYVLWYCPLYIVLSDQNARAPKITVLVILNEEREFIQTI